MAALASSLRRGGALRTHGALRLGATRLSTSYTPSNPRVGTLEAMDGNTAAEDPSSSYKALHALIMTLPGYRRLTWRQLGTGKVVYPQSMTGHGICCSRRATFVILLAHGQSGDPGAFWRCLSELEATSSTEEVVASVEALPQVARVWDFQIKPKFWGIF